MNKKESKTRLAVKVFLCLIYVVIFFILTTTSFRMYRNSRKIINWKNVNSTDQYAYLEISQMSEAFINIKGTNKQIHFVMEKEKDGTWHTYLLAIDKKDYNIYKPLIDYTYERTDKKPNKIIVNGYPKKITKEIKKLAIKNIVNFVPIENEVKLDDKNFEKYMTDTYLDTTIERVFNTNIIIIILLLLSVVILVLTVFTLLDKDKIVDEVDSLIEKEKAEEEEEVEEEKDDDIEIL